MQIRPSKKIVPVIVACLLAVGAVVFAAEYPEIKNKNGSESNVSSAKDKKVLDGSLTATKKPVDLEMFKQISNLDENSDGIKNWEETLGKIGVKEVAEEDLSETEKFGRELFAKYVDGKKTGTLDQQSLIEELTNKEALNNHKKFTIKDINIIPVGSSSTEEAVRAYGNTIGFILASNPADRNEGELDILNRALSTNDPEELKKIDPIVSGYKKIIDSVKASAVPEEISLAHIELLNNLQATMENIDGLRKIFDDPIPGLLSLKQYLAETVSLKQALQKLVAVFESNGVVFTQSEYGYVLVRTI